MKRDDVVQIIDWPNWTAERALIGRRGVVRRVEWARGRPRRALVRLFGPTGSHCSCERSCLWHIDVTCLEIA